MTFVFYIFFSFIYCMILKSLINKHTDDTLIHELSDNQVKIDIIQLITAIFLSVFIISEIIYVIYQSPQLLAITIGCILYGFFSYARKNLISLIKKCVRQFLEIE